MTAKIIDGKSFAEGLRHRIAAEVERLKRERGITPGLAVVIVGNDPGSQVYVANKAKQTVEVGMHSEKYELAEETSEADVLALVERLNQDPKIHGILVQLPLPKQIDPNRVIATISPDKDVDCFTPASVGKLTIGLPGPVSCTPLGCLMLLRDQLGSLEGLNAVIVGRSNLVGKPMAQLLLRENCTVTVAHSRTRDLPEVVRRADIVVAAVGRPQMVKGDWIKPGATVIDVGINRIAAPEKGEGKTRLVGDVDFATAVEVAGAITPVPGGVGPMTIACLLANTVTTASLINGLEPPGDADGLTAQYLAGAPGRFRFLQRFPAQIPLQSLGRTHGRTQGPAPVSRADINLALNRGNAVLGLLERAEVPPVPAIYTLLYDFVAGVNSIAGLRAGAMVQRAKEKPSGETGARLYEEFIRPYEPGEATHRAIARMVERLAVLDAMIAETHEASRAQSASMAAATTVLERDAVGLPLMREWISRLTTANDVARDANARLADELEDARLELAQARGELDQLSRSSLIDPLTGIANRAGLDKALAGAISDARQGKSRMALAVVDIDHFKRFNDSYGHQVGDKVLQLVGKALQATSRSVDVVGRMGGDEFLAVLHHTNPDGALTAATHICKSIRDSDLSKLLGDEILGSTTVSVGVACFRDDDSIASLLERADRCLFEAKTHGRNRAVGDAGS